MDILNFDLLWVGIAVAGAGTLGYTIYFSQPKSSTARAFLFFCVVSMLWSVANFASARVTDPIEILWAIRVVLFFASWHSFAFFALASQFPAPISALPKNIFLGLVAWTSAISLTVLTPLVFSSAMVTPTGVTTTTGPGIALFALTVFGYLGVALWYLARRYFSTSGSQRRQIQFVLVGLMITFVFLITFDFVFPAFFNIPTLVPYGGLFLLPFILGTAYAIMQHRLFNARVAIYGMLTFLLATATFFDVLLSNSFWIVLYRTAELSLVLVAGVWLIRSMVHEFELETELAETNVRQEGLIRFISHEVKNFLTKDLFAFTALMDGDFGSVPDDTRAFVERARSESAGSLVSVMDILKASNQKKGTVEYKKETFDLKAEVAAQVEKLSAQAKEKGLALTFFANPAEGAYAFTGDKAELGDHVFGNLIENAINYTPAGSVAVTLATRDGRYILSVADTGVGISPEDRARLFTEGGHGKDSQKINVHSTGYGLYIAKNIVTAHGGAIRAESGGAGKGSTFTVELPALVA